MGNFAARLKRADPWSDFFESRQSLKDAMAAVKRPFVFDARCEVDIYAEAVVEDGPRDFFDFSLTRS